MENQDKIKEAVDEFVSIAVKEITKGYLRGFLHGFLFFWAIKLLSHYVIGPIFNELAR